MCFIFTPYLSSLYLKTNHIQKWYRLCYSHKRLKRITYPNLNNFLYKNINVKGWINNLVDLSKTF